MYQYIPSQNSALKMSSSSSYNYNYSHIPFTQDYKSYLENSNAKVIGSEMVNGKLCKIYEYTDNDLGYSYKVWVPKDMNFPVKIDIYSRNTTGAIMQAKILKYKVNPNISQDRFELPAGVNIVDLSDPQKLLGNLLGGGRK